MIFIAYDKDGESYRDADCIPALEELARTAQKYPDFNYVLVTGNGIMLVAVQVVVYRGLIPHEDIRFVHEGQSIRIDHKGRPQIWPIGFGDLWENMLQELLG